MRILVTGSREWTDKAVLEAALMSYLRQHPGPPHEDVIVHGGARGADSLAHAFAERWNIRVERYSVTSEDWRRYGKSAGHRRNARMVALGADVCMAFPIGKSAGTRGCMALAKRAGIPVVVHEGVDHMATYPAGHQADCL
jgi:hypothetical protein